MAPKDPIYVWWKGHSWEMKFHDFLSLLVWKNSIFALLLFCGLGLVLVTELGFSAGSLSSTWTEMIWDLWSQGERGRMCVYLCVHICVCVGVHNLYTHVCLSTNSNTAFSHLWFQVSFGRDFEQQLSFYVESRSMFCNLEPVLVQLIHVSILVIGSFNECWLVINMLGSVCSFSYLRLGLM